MIQVWALVYLYLLQPLLSHLAVCGSLRSLLGPKFTLQPCTKTSSKMKWFTLKCLKQSRIPKKTRKR